jgi:hypothetical protein
MARASKCQDSGVGEASKLCPTTRDFSIHNIPQHALPQLRPCRSLCAKHRPRPTLTSGEYHIITSSTSNITSNGRRKRYAKSAHFATRHTLTVCAGKTGGKTGGKAGGDTSGKSQKSHSAKAGLQVCSPLLSTHNKRIPACQDRARRQTLFAHSDQLNTSLRRG